MIGSGPAGAPVHVDIEELLASRLLVQGNSGSGKSYLLRRLLEESAGLVQQVVVDPEGDFVTLAERYGHVVVNASDYTGAEIAQLGARIREHRASVVLALDGLEVDAQMRCVAVFLSALFDAPRSHWYPALVVVDEAQVFAPAAAGEVSDEARRVSLAAMTNLMCRGRKRGLAGVIATQRLAKLAKNVAAEASNFLMGRTFLDIDMARAADLLGMERKQAEQIRDLDRGQFLALGPAISRRPAWVRIGSVQTSSRSASASLIPLPSTSTEELHALVHTPELPSLREAAESMLLDEPVSAESLLDQISGQAERADQPLGPTDPELLERDPSGDIADILAEMAAEDGITYQPPAALYQDFSVRSRMRGMRGDVLDLDSFRRRFAMALGGIPDPTDEKRAAVLKLSTGVADDLLGPFLLLAKAAQDADACPTDEEIARVYGTSSKGRVRWLLEHLEKTGLIVVRTDFAGRRSVGIPELGIASSPSDG